MVSVRARIVMVVGSKTNHAVTRVPADSHGKGVVAVRVGDKA